MNIGEPLRTIIVEPFELPVKEPGDNPEAEPQKPEPEAEPEPVPATGNMATQNVTPVHSVPQFLITSEEIAKYRNSPRY